MHRATASSLLLLLPAIAALQVAGCGSTQVMSPYRSHPFTIDADSREWSGAPLYTDKSGISISTAHDDEYLYLLVTAAGQSLQSQIMRGGCTVWFDPSGGTDEVIGIRYPIGRPGGPPPDERAPGFDAMEPPSMNEQPDPELELLGPGQNDRMMVSLLTEKQLQVKLSTATGALIYELRIPLLRDDRHPCGIGVTTDQSVGIGVVTAARGREGMGRPREGREGMTPPDGGGPPGDGSMPPGGGRRGGAGGPRGGGPHGGSRGEGTQTNPLDVWITARLEK